MPRDYRPTALGRLVGLAGLIGLAISIPPLGPRVAPAGAPSVAPAVADWPCWRGPTLDGRTPEVPATMPQVKLLWKHAMVGLCLAGLASAEGVVVVPDGNKTQDVYHCYQADTGKETWTFRTPTGKDIQYGSAPRATPCIRRGKVFVLGAAGDLHALDLKTGKHLWRKDFMKEYRAGGEPPVWGYCPSPLVADGKLIVFPGGRDKAIVALDPDTGKEVWTGPGAGPNYASFIAARFGGVEQVVGFDSNDLSGWDVKTGRRLWKMEVDNTKGYVVPTPIPAGEKLIIATDSENTRRFGFEPGGRIIPKAEAENEDLAPEMATPTVLGEGLLGGTDGLIYVELAGKLRTLWIEDKVKSFAGVVHIMASGDRALVFGEDGSMTLVAADKAKCTILGTAKLCDKTWSHPALAGGRLFIRDEKTLYAYDLRSPSAAAAKRQ